MKQQISRAEEIENILLKKYKLNVKGIYRDELEYIAAMLNELVALSF